jgi:hypothetical protein
MGKKDSRIDAYIDSSAEFARPILKRLRKLVHQGCPDVEETIKWGMPYFGYKGLLCGMAAFKQHCAFVFWRDIHLKLDACRKDHAMGQFGRIESLDDLPDDDVLLGFLRDAVAQRDEQRPTG